MKPIKHDDTDLVFELMGGTEENDLPVSRIREDGAIVNVSEWELTTEEREAVAKGANICLKVWGVGHPPVAMYVEEKEIVCLGFPNCTCSNKQWSSKNDPHGIFGKAGMMGG